MRIDKMQKELSAIVEKEGVLKMYDRADVLCNKGTVIETRPEELFIHESIKDAGLNEDEIIMLSEGRMLNRDDIDYFRVI